MIHRGIVSTYDSVTHTASVQLVGFPGQLDAVPVAAAVPTTELAPGSAVVIAFWPDSTAVVLASYAP